MSDRNVYDGKDELCQMLLYVGGLHSHNSVFPLSFLFFLSCNCLCFFSSSFLNSSPFPSLPHMGESFHTSSTITEECDPWRVEVILWSMMLQLWHISSHRGMRGWGGSIVFRALWKQLSSKSRISVRVRGWKPLNLWNLPFISPNKALLLYSCVLLEFKTE